MSEEGRYRNLQMKIWMTFEEKQQLKRNMQQAGYQNMGGYLLKMGLDGFVIHVDFSAIQSALGDVGDLRKAFGAIGNNINQIAKHVNESREIDAMDFYLLQKEVEGLKTQMKQFEQEVIASFEQKLKELEE